MTMGENFNKKEYTKEEIEEENINWARFLYKLYKERKDIVKIVLEE